MQNKPCFTAVIVAAGSSTRMGFDKLLYKIAGKEVVRYSIQIMDSHPDIAEIVIVAGENMFAIEALLTKYPVNKPYKIVKGGACRALSVKAGVEASTQEFIAVHDAARPFASHTMITRTMQAAIGCGCAAPAIAVKDTIKQVDGNVVVNTVTRSSLRAVQTPQIFNKEEYLQALSKFPESKLEDITDDCMLMELAGKQVVLVEGDEKNVKITTPKDIEQFETAGSYPRIGHGFDVHRLEKGRKLILGGIQIPFEKGLLGHSDADVLLHAISDALLGACALGDIGKHFPDTDPAFKNANSFVLLQNVVEKVREEGYVPANIDATILCQAPKLAPYIQEMRESVAKATGLLVGNVSVKATTEEKLGYVGEGKGISAHCVVMVVPVEK